MAAHRSLIGARFGRLVVTGNIDASGHHRLWACRCDCGGGAVIRGSHLRTGAIRSCGCLRAEVAAERKLRHGQGGRPGARTKEYRAWAAAKNRCENPNNNRYSSYGARGIRMCARWADDFEAFFADMGVAPDGYEIDRIDVNGHYEPGNCRWAPADVQATNKRNTRMIELFDGSRMPASAAARHLGVDPRRLAPRLERGWTFGVAVVRPIGYAASV